MTKLSETARLVALRIICDVLEGGAYANLALTEHLQKAKLSSVEKRLATELAYGTIRAVGTLDWYLSQVLSRPLAKVTPVIRNILREAVYQLLYLDKIPESAAVNEAVNLAKQKGHAGTVRFVNGVLRNFLRQRKTMLIPSLEQDPLAHIALTYWHPKWLVEQFIASYGVENAMRLCAYNNKPHPFTVRVNTLRTTREELLGKLRESGLEAVPSAWCPEGIVITGNVSAGEFMAKYGTLVYAESEAAMVVGSVIKPQPHAFVLDLCAAPGGKATHMAQMMGNTGTVIATDLHPHKIKLIESNAKRLGLSIIKATVSDATMLRAELVGKADVVLVDAPCSGLGVLGARAEARWRKTKEEMAELPALQTKILSVAAGYVKVGGRLVYSTCTILEAENSAVVASFLKEHVNYRLTPLTHPLTGERLEQLQLLPYRDGIDGFYVAVLTREA